MRFLCLMVFVALLGACSDSNQASATSTPVSGGPSIKSPAAAASASASGSQPAMPQVLSAFLQANPEFHLVNGDDVRQLSEYQVDQSNSIAVESAQKRYSQFMAEGFRPYIVADTNRDGKDDTVAVVVADNKYNLIVFHGSAQNTSETPLWIVRDYPRVVAGIDILDNGGILAMECVGCDSVAPIVWTGSEYESDAHPPGDHVCVDGNTTIYAKPDVGSPVIMTTTGLGLAKVVSIGKGVAESDTAPKEGGYRWYRVKLDKAPTIEGFIKNRAFLGGFGDCE